MSDPGPRGRGEPGDPEPGGRTPDGGDALRRAGGLHGGTAVRVATAVIVECAGCGHRAAPDEPLPIRCPNAGRDDADHVMTRRLDPSAVAFPDPLAPATEPDGDPNPFVRYRRLFRAWHVARAEGWSDERYVELVRELDEAVARVDGSGFRETPLVASPAIAEQLGIREPGAVWVKDETRNVSGSHKARHLMGALIELVVEERTGRAGTVNRPLAIASCGNAALAAAVVARAADRQLDVFIPPWADPAVVSRLGELGARLTVCARTPDATGDPTVRRLRAAIADGAIPFTCQGNENGLAIEGGETLGWEIATALLRRAAGTAPDDVDPDRALLDRIVVQVGGGALASAVGQSFAEARALGAWPTGRARRDEPRSPRLDTVQTSGAWPLARAWQRVHTMVERGSLGALDWVATHRSAFMWPWETEPTSVAHGILDDETYDWLAVVRAMAETGGDAIVVDEPTLREANRLGREATGIDADETGTAGLAGLLHLSRHRDLRSDETVAVLFTGIRRAAPPPATDPPVTESIERSAR